MKTNKRAQRRIQTAKKKKWARNLLENRWQYKPENINARNIGKAASTHGKCCSCPMCGNPRRLLGEITKQELIQIEKEKYD